MDPQTDDCSSLASKPISLLASPDEGLPPSLDLTARLYLPAIPGPGTHGQPPNHFPGLIVGHGAGSRASRHHQFCHEAANHGFVVLAIDFRGHGDSRGRGDGPLELDLLAAVAFLRHHPAVDPALICYRGSSMGAFYGLKAAPKAGFGAMVLLCPANETTMLRALDRDATLHGQTDTEQPHLEKTSGKGSISSMRVRPSNESTLWDRDRLRSYFERQNSLTLAGSVTCPVLLVHAQGDPVVPFAHSLRIAESLRGPTTLLALPGGDHTTAQHDAHAHVLSLEWLAATIAEERLAMPRTTREK